MTGEEETAVEDLVAEAEDEEMTPVPDSDVQVDSTDVEQDLTPVPDSGRIMQSADTEVEVQASEELDGEDVDASAVDEDSEADVFNEGELGKLFIL